MTMPTTPAPRPLCAAFAPLLPLISSGALEESEATPTREHMAGCAWCQRELARYTAVDEALRRQFGAAAHEGILPFLFDLDGDEEFAAEYAFTLEDTLEESMEDDQVNQQPSTTARSPRWGDRKRALSPRTTAIAGLAAALILAVIATTIYTQFAVRRSGSPAATATPAVAFTKIQGPPSNASIWALAPARDGSLWFSESLNQAVKLGHILPNGDIAEFALPGSASTSTARLTQSDVYSLTVGPDDDIWYIQTELISGANQSAYHQITIGRMTPDGSVKSFALPINVDARQITAGADGALWFISTVTDPNTAVKSSTLARMTTDGQISQYPAPGTDVAFFCVGPDNAIWYTHDTVRSIGRLTSDGKVQEFTIPYYASWLTSGPDGALWYAESDPNTIDKTTLDPRLGSIGRITTAGVATELPIDPKVNPVTLATGADGAIWFLALNPTDHTTSLGRVTPSGETKIIPIRGISQPGLLTAAPGALWLQDSANNTFWRYQLPK
jgi:streptogramin lyase